MKIQVRPNEHIVREGPASIQKGWEAVGGRLWLTDQRLHFRSHALNIASGWDGIELADVGNTKLTWTKFLGVIPLFPNSLSVATAQEGWFDFVLYGRSKWQAASNQQIYIQRRRDEATAVPGVDDAAQQAR